MVAEGVGVEAAGGGVELVEAVGEGEPAGFDDPAGVDELTGEGESGLARWAVREGAAVLDSVEVGEGTSAPTGLAATRRADGEFVQAHKVRAIANTKTAMRGRGRNVIPPFP